MDGLPVPAMANSNATNFVVNLASIQELTVDTAGLSAEDNAGGVRLSIIPREGGNQLHAMTFVDWAGPSLQSVNFTDDLAARGYPSPNPLKPLVTNYNFNPAAGGPLKRDKLWFYAAVNRIHTVDYRAVYPNKNAGNPNAWLYVPDPNGEFSKLDLLAYGVNGRVTWQVTPKNKLAFYSDHQGRCICPQADPALSPEAQGGQELPTMRFTSVIYTAPISNRLVVDAAALDRLEVSENGTQGGVPVDPSIIGVIDTGTGLTYRSPIPPFGVNRSIRNKNRDVRGAVSLVTGAHALKAGVQTEFQSNHGIESNPGNTQQVTYRFTNGVPNQITEYSDPREYETLVTDAGLFVQDRWTVKRVTLTGGLRYDYYNSHFPDQALGPITFAPTRNVSFPASDGVRWKDITTRMGAVVDVSGDGRTAVRVALNKYLAGMNTGTTGAAVYSMGYQLNPVNRVAASTTRSWNDANKNFVPDCVLSVVAANGECGALANTSFGQPVVSTSYDPALLTGWGNRLYNWEFLVGVQQQVLDRVALDASYVRRTYGNLITTDNLAVAASDFTKFSIVVPVDSRLPDGGGYTVAGMYDVNPAKFGQTNNFVTLASNYGEEVRRWHGVDMNVSVRAIGGLTFRGGFSTGAFLQDTCAVREQVPEEVAAFQTPFPAINPLVPYCRSETLWLTQVKGLGTYSVPKVGVEVSAGFQSMPGPAISANLNATNALTQPSLGRPLSGGAANVPVNLIPTGTLYGERMNDVDLRFGKIFHFRGHSRISANVDLYNAFNRSTVIVENSAYAPTTTTWRQPQSIISPRLVKLSAQIDF